MTSKRVAPFGAWESPVTSDLIVTSTVGLTGVYVDGDDLYWLESRPSEGGRNVIVRQTTSGGREDVTPQGFNVRTRVHEYGGGAALLGPGRVFYFANFTDQRLYRQKVGSSPKPITPHETVRYADGVVDERHGRTIWVVEDQRNGGEPQNSIAAVPLEGGPPEALVSGSDFYSAPRVSPDGTRLAWLAWDHPNMPWDGCDLWVADVTENGSLANQGRVAGGPDEALFQPAWSSDGVLYFVSDRNGWWNLYRRTDSGVEPVVEMEAELGLPYWQLGMSTYTFRSANEAVATFCERGEWKLGLVDLKAKKLRRLETPFTRFQSMSVKDATLTTIASSPTQAAALVRLDLSSGAHSVITRSSSVDIDSGCFSVPEHTEFPTEGGLTAYGFYYPPKNRDFDPPAGERPPLIVKSHGGPTGATDSSLSLRVQYWTSRGFAVLDVNYGGSTGYGREYRRRLDGLWGIVDVDDCVNGAKHLVERGVVDGERLAITGGSAGGYTTLAALTFRDVFDAGASHYGVSDCEALAKETHKFESRYLDRLIGPYPARRDIYVERSPVHHTDRLSCPVAFFQGLEDEIVPPNQAEMMVEALRAKRLPVAYVAFEGEQHGFRRAENIKRALDGELYFYSRIFGFEPAGEIEPIEIENL